MVKEYGGKVRVAYKNMVVHPDTAMTGHKAACAAGRQGKFMEFKTLFWEEGFGAYASSRDPSKMNEAAVTAMAQKLGLDVAKFSADLKGPDCAKRIEDDMAELGKFGVQATPSFFINGTMIPGALPPEQFKAIIDEKLKIAQASGVPAAKYYQAEIMAKGEKKFRSKKAPKPK
ncbi:MAG: DsbA family protein [Kofleriaceae bacterium]|nr:DsbA family protein [Kofleriaceae bacterium]MBP6836353.1 DsbA family protein [Kofleriaceae bacterium]MBP9204371.1 DsbA family protein [Kofleriaceae bacterium]